MSHHYPIPTSTEAVPLHKFFRYFAPMVGRDSFLDRAFDRNCRGLEFVADGWVAAVLAVEARGTVYWDLMRSARDILLNKVINPAVFLLESLVYPDAHDSDRFVKDRTRYWAQMLLNHVKHEPGMHQKEEITLNFRNPQTLLDSFGPEPHIKVVVLRPLAYQAQASPQDGDQPLGLESIEHRDQCVAGSAVFFASRVYHLRMFSEILDMYHTEDSRHERALHELYNVLLSMLLCFIAFADRIDIVNGELSASPEDWRAVRAAVDAVGLGSHFGSGGYELNCHFLTRNKVELQDWFEGAAQWWCPNDPGKREVLTDAAKAMEEVLYWLFGLAAKV